MLSLFSTFVIVFVFVFVFVNFFGHVMSSHHSDQMSQRSQVSRIALRRYSQNVFVFVIVFDFVFVFVKFLVMTCLLITLTKCLKGHKSQPMACHMFQNQKWLIESVSGSFSDKVTY